MLVWGIATYIIRCSIATKGGRCLEPPISLMDSLLPSLAAHEADDENMMWPSQGLRLEFLMHPSSGLGNIKESLVRMENDSPPSPPSPSSHSSSAIGESREHVPQGSLFSSSEHLSEPSQSGITAPPLAASGLPPQLDVFIVRDPESPIPERGVVCPPSNIIQR